MNSNYITTVINTMVQVETSFNRGKYIVREKGKYITKKNYQQSELISIMMELIDRYERFEYDCNLYHSPELGIWTKE